MRCCCEVSHVLALIWRIIRWCSSGGSWPLISPVIRLLWMIGLVGWRRWICCFCGGACAEWCFQSCGASVVWSWCRGGRRLTSRKRCWTWIGWCLLSVCLMSVGSCCCYFCHLCCWAVVTGAHSMAPTLRETCSSSKNMSCSSQFYSNQQAADLRQQTRPPTWTPLSYSPYLPSSCTSYSVRSVTREVLSSSIFSGARPHRGCTGDWDLLLTGGPLIYSSRTPRCFPDLGRPCPSCHSLWAVTFTSHLCPKSASTQIGKSICPPCQCRLWSA